MNSDGIYNLRTLEEIIHFYMFDGLNATGFNVGLEKLVRELSNDRQLTMKGQGIALQFIVNSLANRMLLGEQESKAPEVRAVAIEEPVFILGLPRSGTTYLHHLLARHPNLHAPQFWELTQPVTPAGKDQAGLIKASSHRLSKVYGNSPEFRTIHSAAPQDPEECTWLLMNEFASMAFSVNFRLPKYTEWLIEHDMTREFTGHRRQLQHILWRRPLFQSSLLLKDPYHGFHLDAIDAVYPDARFIFVQRHSAAVKASLCSLIESVRSASYQLVDTKVLGADCNSLIQQLSEHQARFRRDLPIGDRAIDVDFNDLTLDTKQTLRKITRFLKLPDCNARMDEALTNFKRRQKVQGPHVYNAKRYGLAGER